MNEEKQQPEDKQEVDLHRQDSGPETEPQAVCTEEEWTQLKQQLLRLQADFDNFRRRTAEERIRLREQAQGDLVTALLPVLDHFDLALSHTPTQGDEEVRNAFLDGFKMIRRQLEEVLSEFGVQEIEALGATMDPSYHEAMLRVTNPKYREGEIVQVLKKGYQMGDRVLRAAQVQVGYPEE